MSKIERYVSLYEQARADLREANAVIAVLRKELAEAKSEIEWLKASAGR